jgi:hypothetical protein
MVSSDVMIAAQSVANKHRVGAKSVEPTMGFVHEVIPFQGTAAVQLEGSLEMM